MEKSFMWLDVLRKFYNVKEFDTERDTAYNAFVGMLNKSDDFPFLKYKFQDFGFGKFSLILTIHHGTSSYTLSKSVTSADVLFTTMCGGIADEGLFHTFFDDEDLHGHMLAALKEHFKVTDSEDEDEDEDEDETEEESEDNSNIDDEFSKLSSILSAMIGAAEGKEEETEEEAEEEEEPTERVFEGLLEKMSILTFKKYTDDELVLLLELAFKEYVRRMSSK